MRHGDYVAKIRLAPATENTTRVIHRELDLRGRPDVFYPTLVDELQASAFDFDLQVQLCTDLEVMPVNEATVEWPEKLSPFVTVGRVHIPRQDISGTENLEKTDALAFNQWRVTEEHRPLGEIMQVRRIYSASAKVRRTLNHQPQTEPASADEVLPYTVVAAAPTSRLSRRSPRRYHHQPDVRSTHGYASFSSDHHLDARAVSRRAHRLWTGPLEDLWQQCGRVPQGASPWPVRRGRDRRLGWRLGAPSLRLVRSQPRRHEDHRLEHLGRSAPATLTPSRAAPTERPMSTPSWSARARTSRGGRWASCSGPSARAC